MSDLLKINLDDLETSQLFQQKIKQLNIAQKNQLIEVLNEMQDMNKIKSILYLIRDLNPEQTEAVLHNHKDGPLLILACAGSGKTTTLTNRVAYLILKGIEPLNILAMTFTVKAAEEMRSRIIRFISSLIEKNIIPGNDLLIKISNMWIGTFHSVSLRILKEAVAGKINIERLGYSPGFTILDETNQIFQEVASDIAKANNLKIDEIQQKIEKLKEELLDVERFTEKATTQEKPFLEAYRRYEKHLKDMNAIDFGDMIMLVVKLFRNNPDIYSLYLKRFKYVLIDEYQDTNYSQYILSKLLIGVNKNLFVVGDDDQSIYGWRGADFRNILFFEKDFPDTKRINLVKNYRSVPEIINIANQVFKKVKESKYLKLIQPTKTKSTFQEAKKMLLYKSKNEFDEGSFVANEIHKIVSNYPDISYRNISVIARTHSQTQFIRKVLTAHKIPTAVYNPNLYKRKEIQDICLYLKLISFLSRLPDSLPERRQISEVIKNLLIYPPVSIEGLDLQIITHTYDLTDLFIKESIREDVLLRVDNQTKNKILNFFSYFLNAKKIKNLRDLFFYIVKEGGYLSWINSQNISQKEKKDSERVIFALLNDFSDFEKSYFFDNANLNIGNKIELVLDLIKLKTQDTQQSSPYERQDAVNIMSIHSAKGLEFDVVFFIGVEDEVIPHKHFLEEFSSKQERKQKFEEERRLFYVAITRAKERLYFSYCSQRTIKNKIVGRKISPFLKELINDDFQFEYFYKNNLQKIIYYLKKIINWFRV